MRICLKLSGEAFANSQGFGFDTKKALSLIDQIKKLIKKKHEIIIICGAGNIFRGRDRKEFEIGRYRADQMGMLSTLINALFLEQLFLKAKQPVKILNSFENRFVEKYRVEKALEYLKKESVIICSGGLGHPYFTTDSLAALRARELKADKVLKATNVDGVYDKDPKKSKTAKRFSSLTFSKALSLELNIMDLSAFTLLKEGNIEICVFDLFQKNAIIDAVEKSKGTTIKGV